MPENTKDSLSEMFLLGQKIRANMVPFFIRAKMFCVVLGAKQDKRHRKYVENSFDDAAKD